MSSRRGSSGPDLNVYEHPQLGPCSPLRKESVLVAPGTARITAATARPRLGHSWLPSFRKSTDANLLTTVRSLAIWAGLPNLRFRWRTAKRTMPQPPRVLASPPSRRPVRPLRTSRCGHNALGVARALTNRLFGPYAVLNSVASRVPTTVISTSMLVRRTLSANAWLRSTSTVRRKAARTQRLNESPR